MASYTTIGPYTAGGIPEQWVHAWNDVDNVDINLTGYQVDVYYRVNRGAQVVLDTEASLFDAATGRTVVTWSAADFAAPGIMEGEIVVAGDGLRLARSFQCVIRPPRGSGTVYGPAPTADLVAEGVAAHVAAVDPHTGYLTTAEGTALVAAHAAAADPHTGYLTAAEAQAVAVGGDLTGTVANAQIAAGAVGLTELAAGAKPTIVVSGTGLDYTGATDSSTALAALITQVQATGGTLQFLPGILRVDSQLVIPNNGGAIPEQKPMRWVGGGAHFAGRAMNPNGGTILDLRYSGVDAKIKTRGLGSWESTGITYADNGTSSGPFILTTNTTLLFHHNAFSGNPAKATSTCDQDAIILGGTTTTLDGTDNSPFQGYGTVIDSNYFHRIRRGVYGRTYCNGVVIRDNTWWATCGGTVGAAVEFDGGASVCTGNHVTGNLIEVLGYVYGMRMTATVNCYFANSFYDPSAGLLAFYLFDTGASFNLVQDVYRNDTYPLVSEVPAVAGQNTAITAHQSQTTTIVQPWKFTNAATAVDVLGTFKATGGAAKFVVQPAATVADGGTLMLVSRSAAEATNPGTDVLRLIQTGKLTLGGDGAGNIDFLSAAGAVVAQFASGGKQWVLAGAGGPMLIDSGSGGSNVDVKGYRLRFIDQGGTRRIALASGAPADASVNTSEMVIWYDDTAGAAKLMVKAKNASGTVVTGQIALT